MVSLNTARFDTTKHLATPILSDAKVGLKQLSEALGDWKAPAKWFERAIKERKEWDAYVTKNTLFMLNGIIFFSSITDSSPVLSLKFGNFILVADLILVFIFYSYNFIVINHKSLLVLYCF